MNRYIRISAVAGVLAFCCNVNAQNPPFIPGSAEAAGLTRIVPDTLIWFNTTTMKPTIGGYDDLSAAVPGSSVEATVSVLGDSTFLLAATTQATNDSTMMSFTSVFQPATGGTPKLDNLWYDDSGKPFLTQINLSRQTGNPGRIGGDPRYGSVNYAGAGEVSLYAYSQFNSDGRWSNPFFDYVATLVSGGFTGGRSYAGQIHQLNPLTLASTPKMKAVDTMYGRLWTNTVPTVTGADIGRTGSSPIGLDNGNFVFVGEDRSALNNLGGNRRAAVATIFAPDGSIVKEAFMVSTNGQSDGSMWNSVGAFRGGFFVRPATGIIKFYNNAGDLQGEVDHNATAGVSFDLGRSDGTRMCSDIRSHYVFMAGKSPETGGYTNIVLCAWDANTRLWITNVVVSEGNQDPTDLGGLRVLDRCNLACDAYNRVAVIFRMRPDNAYWTADDQVAARVYQFDGTKFTALTPEFFPFVCSDTNYAAVMGFIQKEPSVAMTPRQILFYAKGMWSKTGNPLDAPVTQLNTHCYTVVSHPAPIAAPQPQMTIAHGTPNSTISWQADAGLFVLQSTPSLSPTSWTDVSPQPAITRTGYVDANDKYQMSVPTTGSKYFRLIRRW